MTRTGARRMVQFLALADLARRLAFRFTAWLATALAAWSLALLAAVALAESRFGPSPQSFHAFIMAAVAALPAFLAAPFRSSSGLDAVRRSDRGAAVESWLDYPGGPAENLLETRACEALSVAALSGFGRPRPPQKARAIVAALFAVALAAFVVAQTVSIRAGYGISISYPVKEIPDFVALRDAVRPDAEPGIVAPVAVPGDERDAPGARRYAGGQPDEETLAEPDFVATGGPDEGAGGQGQSDAGGNAGKKPATAASRTARSAPDGQSSKGDADRGDARDDDGGDDHRSDDDSGDSDPGDAELGDSPEEARTPGYQGAGRSLESSPLVDYRARFERQLAEATGTETELGDAPSAELVSAAIASFYASFDARVAVGQPLDPSLARVQESWRKAFGAGAGE